MRRSRGRRSECASELEQDAAAGRVVHGAVVEIVAAHRRIDAEMIVVRGEYHGLSRGAGLRSRRQAHHVVRLELAHATLDMRLEADRQLARLEIAGTGKR